MAYRTVMTLSMIIHYCSFTLARGSPDVQIGEYDRVHENLARLAQNIIVEHMLEKRACVTIISEGDGLNGLHLNEVEMSYVVRISYAQMNSSECDPELKMRLEVPFTVYCSNYVVQMSNPGCFLTAWREANHIYHGRKHNPRVLFVPLLPHAVDYVDELFSHNETEISAELLAAEYVSSNNSGEWCVELYTNNFFEPHNTDGRISRILLDKWYPTRGFEFAVDLFPDKMIDLRGKEVRTFVIHYPPYSNNDPFDGTEVRLVNLFCEKSNCTVTHGTYDDNEWGTIDPEKNISDGCTGFVYNGDADVCIGANYAWLSYWPYVDFSTGYSQGALTIIVPKPTVLTGWGTPFFPFTMSVWICILFCIMISTYGLYKVTVLTYKHSPRLRPLLEASNKFFSLPDAFVRSVGMLVLQQPQQLVAGSPSRYLFTAMELVYLVVTTCYAAELYDCLTIPRTTKPIDNIHDLADANVVWLADSPAYTLMIRNTEDPKLKKATENFRIVTVEDAIALGGKGGYGMVTERLEGGHFVILPFHSDKFIDLSMTMKEPYVASSLFAYFGKGSPYTKRFDTIIGRVLNAGLWYRWEEDTSTKLLDYSKQQKLLATTKKVTYPPKVLRLENLEGAFLVYFIGIFISIIWFIKEIYKPNRVKKS